SNAQRSVSTSRRRSTAATRSNSGSASNIRSEKEHSGIFSRAQAPPEHALPARLCLAEGQRNLLKARQAEPARKCVPRRRPGHERNIPNYQVSRNLLFRNQFGSIILTLATLLRFTFARSADGFRRLRVFVGLNPCW